MFYHPEITRRDSLMANMREVSKESGVSLTSVSRILAGDRSFHVREETRQKVLDTAQKLNYRYVKRETSIIKIGCMLSYTAEKYSDEFFSTILTSIGNSLQETGCSPASLYTTSEIDKVEDLCKQKSLSGLILFEDTLDVDSMERLKSSVPYIVGVETDYEGIDNISHDKYATGVQAIEHLMKRGHKRIAYVGGDERSIHNRSVAYSDLMALRGFPTPPEYFLDCGWEPDRCHDLIFELCAQKNRPTAIFAGSDNLAIAVLSAVRALGLSTPGDVAVVGVNNLDFSAYTSPPLTTVSIPMEEIGTAAVEMLLRRINGFSGLPVKIMYPPKLITRQSV